MAFANSEDGELIMALVKVADVGALQPGNLIKFEHNGEAILVANVDGTYCAIANSCPHAGGDLSRGVIEEGTVTCPQHGARFDLRTGRNVGGAKILLMKILVQDARRFPVTVTGDDVLVEVG